LNPAPVAPAPASACTTAGGKLGSVDSDAADALDRDRQRHAVSRVRRLRLLTGSLMMSLSVWIASCRCLRA
jgi:hypothetical protein